MKALTIWQPWATLIMLSEKRFETRDWVTRYRGPLMIHAAARKTRVDEVNDPIFEILEAHGLKLEVLPLGAALGVVNVMTMWQADVLTTGPDAEPVLCAVDSLAFGKYIRLSKKERCVGNFRPGRFAWDFGCIRQFEEPISAKGAQGLWDWRVPEEITPLLDGWGVQAWLR